MEQGGKINYRNIMASRGQTVDREEAVTKFRLLPFMFLLNVAEI